jgi:hypothetical protein
MTAVAAVVAAGVLYLFPLMGITKPDTFRYQVIVQPISLPPELKNELNLDLFEAVVRHANEMPQISQNYVSSGLMETKDTTKINEKELNTFLRGAFLGKKYKVAISGQIILFEILTNKPECAKDFIDNMIAYAEMRTAEELRNGSKLISDSMSPLYTETRSTPYLSDTVRQLIISSAVYKEYDGVVLRRNSPGVLFIEAQGSLKKIIVIVVAAAIAAILLAFVVEYVYRIRNDAAAMEKISAAWNEKPRLKKREANK